MLFDQADAFQNPRECEHAKTTITRFISDIINNINNVIR